MYTTYVTYALLIGLLIWGGKFAGFKKGQFHEDSTALDVTKSLRGFAALGVILHHISQEGAFQRAGGGWGHPGELSIFVNYGFKFVAIFFFCSGFGLIKSLMTKDNYLDGFLKKRVVKTILIPFYVNVILYAIWHIISGKKMPVAQWICNFLGLTMMNTYAWYPVVLILLYLAFYFIFKYIKNEKLKYVLMFLVIFLQGVYFCWNGHFAWWARKGKNWWLIPGAMQNAKWWMQPSTIWFFGEWWVNSTIAFFVGMLFARFEQPITNWLKKGWWWKILVVAVIYYGFNALSGLAQWKLGYWSEYNRNGPGILNKFICYLSQLPQITFYVILIFMIMMKYHVENPVSRFFGNLSLETYMMNLIALTVFRFLIYQNNQPLYKAGHYNLAIYEVAVIAGTILLAFVYKYLNKGAILLFDKVTTKKKPVQPVPLENDTPVSPEDETK